MRRWLLVLAWVAGAAGASERHALLVGVSSPPALPRSAWLDGPRHDVPAMRNALQAQGFAASRIVSLADGVDGAAAPTRDAILARLAHYAKTLQADDVLVIYWSGHGLLMPGRPSLWQTPFGQQVRLLAQDARVDGRNHQLTGTVSSADIGHAIDALAARRVQVVAMFDTCHAAASTRGDAGLAWRGLASPVLRTSPRAMSVAGRPASGASTSPPASAAGPRERPLFIGFFAAESLQRSAEALASDHPGQARGIFTRALIAGLRDNPASYLAWASLTSAYYRQAFDERQLPPSARPSPVYAGALEHALWTAAVSPASWPVRQDGRGWYVPYGRLDGLRVDDVLQRGADAWRVTGVGWNEARLAASGQATAGWARRLPAPAQVPAFSVLERRRGASTVDLSLPGQASLRLRVPDEEVPALRARATSIATVLALPSTAAAAPLLQARIEVTPPGQGLAVSLPFVDRDLGPLAPGTRLRVIVENGGENPADAGIVHLPLTGPATRVFPRFEGDSNRLPPHSGRFERAFEVTAQDAAAAPEWLVLVAAPASNGAMPRRFALFDALRDPASQEAERGAALAGGRRPEAAQVARVSWQVANGGGQ
ncbi:caspase family protein [Telluria beijingensis]|uniref:caspase family protein n=1 Tax=Telluria beijingensis TaxID=3068633 RepID=UPI00279580F2|nr:caspase family protein [Massilia sp. REN29]